MRAVHYLRSKGLSNDEVADYLVEELKLDRDTARSMVVVAA
jgi:orotate phosphoribosyltransferase-like protein